MKNRLYDAIIIKLTEMVQIPVMLTSDPGC